MTIHPTYLILSQNLSHMYTQSSGLSIHPFSNVQQSMAGSQQDTLHIWHFPRKSRAPKVIWIPYMWHKEKKSRLYVLVIPGPLTVEFFCLEGALHKNEQTIISLLVGGGYPHIILYMIWSKEYEEHYLSPKAPVAFDQHPPATKHQTSQFLMVSYTKRVCAKEPCLVVVETDGIWRSPKPAKG